MELTIRILKPSEYALTLPLAAETHPDVEPDLLRQRLEEMQDQHYNCAAAFMGEDLVGLCGFWITTRFYSGKQIEVDNVAVTESMRSKGVGKQMMAWVCDYARSIGCSTCELNTYVHNARSHKFYFNDGFTIIGYHMHKDI